MEILFDITFYEAPCELINTDFVDVIGNHQPNVEQGIEKIRINPVNQSQLDGQNANDVAYIKVA